MAYKICRSTSFSKKQLTIFLMNCTDTNYLYEELQKADPSNMHKRERQRMVNLLQEIRLTNNFIIHKTVT